MIKSIIKKIIGKIIFLYNLSLAKRYYKTTVFDYNPKEFQGKSIAIVGPADTALLKKNGAYIDSFDVVIRINRSIDNYLEKQEYLGTKTDVLFHGLDENPIGGCGLVRPDEWKMKGVKKVVFPLFGVYFENLVNKYTVRSKGSLPLYRISEKEYWEITEALNGFRTTTGFAAIYLMSKVSYSKLFITGFTFFRTPYQTDYNSKVSRAQVKELIKKANNHNPEFEFEYFRKFYLNSTNVEIDDGMKEILR